MNPKMQEELLTAISVALAALFLSTVITLIIARYYKKIRAFFLRCCCPEEKASESEKNEEPRSPHGISRKNGSVPHKKMIDSSKGSMSQSIHSLANMPPMLLSSCESQFTIPGTFLARSIQPELKLDNFSDDSIPMVKQSSGSSSSSPFERRPVFASTVSLPANFTPRSPRTNKGKNKPLSKTASPAISSCDEDYDDNRDDDDYDDKGQRMSVEDLMFLNINPDLYDLSKRKTIGKGGLGKIFISFQYEDKSRRKLNLFLKRMIKLRFVRSDIIGIYASIVLLPERESTFTSNQQPANRNPDFEEKFVFPSRPMNRDFESKTALILVHYTDRASKDIIYGEARIPLLSREIYSQVETDVTLNIKAASMQSEFGDLLVQMIYNETGTLSVMVKIIKVPLSVSLENMSALKVKCYMKRLGNKLGRKQSFSCQLLDNKQQIMELNGECYFKIAKEHFMDSDVHCAVRGKHKLLGKKLNLGKAVIGFNAKDETGAVHWRTIFNSPGVAWSVWHPIYNT